MEFVTHLLCIYIAYVLLLCCIGIHVGLCYVFTLHLRLHGNYIAFMLTSAWRLHLHDVCLMFYIALALRLHSL
ncbi:hypothetical protein GDO81_018013 [Engystomops pustulosus]|uniref:Uncharacterized protein n=1 Tax=Engystomops pustulosus TaxID=76066 RepID=A0AAV7A4V6_ENGPU|nr:hypothetical protein GDO81_018013 [Engystomops pustulosus]